MHGCLEQDSIRSTRNEGHHGAVLPRQKIAMELTKGDDAFGHGTVPTYVLYGESLSLCSSALYGGCSSLVPLLGVLSLDRLVGE